MDERNGEAICPARDQIDLKPGALHVHCDRPANHEGVHWDQAINWTWFEPGLGHSWPRGTRPDSISAGDESTVLTLKARRAFGAESP